MIKKTIFILLCLILLLPLDSHSGLFEGEHSIQDIISAIKAPLTKEEIDQAREADDELLTSGNFGGVKGYLITDPQITEKPRNIVNNLLQLMGEDPNKWVIRIIETDPPEVNAFVTGGKYIYIYKKLLDEVSSNDELAFIMAHELGHSFLHHGTRRRHATSQILANLTELIAALSKGEKGLSQVIPFTQAVKASYSRESEAEADVFAVMLLNKSNYSSLRGIDFFTRQSKKEQDLVKSELKKLEEEKTQYFQALQQCNQYKQAYQIYRTYEAYINMQNACTNAENLRLRYNSHVESYNNMLQNMRPSIYMDHPSDNQRIALIAAINDYLNGRRDLESLKDKYPIAYNVIYALKTLNHPIVVEKKPIENQKNIVRTNKVNPVQNNNEDEIYIKLRKLKDLFENGLITEEEYNNKKKELLDKL